MTVPASVEMVNILGPRDEFLHILERELEAEDRLGGVEHGLLTEVRWPGPALVSPSARRNRTAR